MVGIIYQGGKSAGKTMKKKISGMGKKVKKVKKVKNPNNVGWGMKRGYSYYDSPKG